MFCTLLEQTTDPTQFLTLLQKVIYILSYSVLAISPRNEASDSLFRVFNPVRQNFLYLFPNFIFDIKGHLCCHLAYEDLLYL